MNPLIDHRWPWQPLYSSEAENSKSKTQLDAAYSTISLKNEAVVTHLKSDEVGHSDPKLH